MATMEPLQTAFTNATAVNVAAYTDGELALAKMLERPFWTVSTICTVFSSTLSILGALFLIGRYINGRRGPGRKQAADATAELVFILAMVDLITSVSHGFSILPARTLEVRQEVTNICKLQGFGIMFGMVAQVWWNFFISYNLFRWVCYADDQQTQLNRVRWSLLVTVTLGLATAIGALFDNAYGYAALWCWVPADLHGNKGGLWRAFALYLWLALGVLAMIFFLVRVKQNVNERLLGAMTEESKAAYRDVVKRLSVCVIGFMLCWIPALINRTLESIQHTNDITPFNELQAATLTLQGFWNAVAFGNFHMWVFYKLIGRWTPKTLQEPEGTNFAKLRDVQERENKNFGMSSIFAATIDMEWTPFPVALEKWITPGQDIYVFTLLHCTAVEEAEDTIGRHLLVVNQPMNYRSITSLTGTHRRGPTQSADVCQIIFANTYDVENGHLEYSPSDSRMWASGKPLQQAIGVNARYFNTAVALVSCQMLTTSTHLPTSTNADVICRALGLNTRRYDHILLSGALPQGLGVTSASTTGLRFGLRSIHSWTEDEIAPGGKKAICQMFQLEVDRLGSALV